MEVLLVENDSLFASTFAEAMAVHGLRVHVETNTQAAILRLVGGAIPGMVLLKWGLPGLRTEAVAAGMRGTPGMRFVPVVVVAGGTPAELDDLARRACAHGALKAPLVPRDVLGWMHRNKQVFPAGTALPPWSPPGPTPAPAPVPAPVPASPPALARPSVPGPPPVPPSAPSTGFSAPPQVPSDAAAIAAIRLTPSGKLIPDSVPPPRPEVAPPPRIQPPPGIRPPPGIVPPVPSIPVAPAPSPPEDRIHVLIGDHDIVAFEAAYRILTGKGFKVTHAPDWDALYEQFHTRRYAVVLLEVDMPGVEDHHLSIFSNHKDGTPNPRILLYSNLGEGELARMVVELGASGYLTKGSRESSLLDAVGNQALGFLRELP